MVYRTLELKIESPSGVKRARMDDALTRYTRAFQSLLDAMESRLPSLAQTADAEAGASARRLAGSIPTQALRTADSLLATPFKDALRMDFAMTMTRLFGMRRRMGGARYPLVRLEGDATDAALHTLHARGAAGDLNLPAFARAFARIIEKDGAIKPLLFCRYAKNRDYCLLYDEAKGRYYAKLYLMSVRDPARLPAQTQPGDRLRYIGLGNSLLEADTRARRYIIVPLAFGRRQAALLDEARTNPSMLKTARLLRRGNAYYLSIVLACPPPAPRACTCFMGIARTLGTYLHYTVCDSAGAVLEQGYLPGDTAPAQTASDTAIDRAMLHALSGRAAHIADRLDAQVIVAGSAPGQSDRLRYTDADIPPMTPGAYRLFSEILAYKLRLSGLPPPVSVSPGGVFTTCPSCGHVSRKSRIAARLFLCTRCGHSAALGTLGSFNLANRLNRYRSIPVPFSVYRTDGVYRLQNTDMGIDFPLEGGPFDLEPFFDHLAQWCASPPDLTGLSARAARRKISLHRKLCAASTLRESVVLRQP